MGPKGGKALQAAAACRHKRVSPLIASARPRDHGREKRGGGGGGGESWRRGGGNGRELLKEESMGIHSYTATETSASM